MLRYVLFVDSVPEGDGISCRTAKGALEDTISRIAVSPIKSSSPTKPSFRQLLEATPRPSQTHIAFCRKCLGVAGVFSEAVELARYFRFRAN